ncbi:homeobox-like protein HDP1 [Hylaeus anthracinus]|uniref:homeobox-like protein HDP1 n=1 Tax=Hylaeus anthracinus TaxID=313031 RepID=UPI0023BA215C|nr:homeobox-like protein HDP1 [Hylaeus anthracinus]
MLQQRVQQNDILGEKFEEIKPNVNETNAGQEINLKGTDLNQQNKANCLKLSNAMYPVLKLLDKHLRPSKMNITFCTEVFSRQSASNMLIPQCEQQKYMGTSQETLYQVKKKLESLHNVLRMYETQNPDTRGIDREQETSKKINSICQNMMDTLVSVTTEVDNRNEKRQSRVSFDTDTKGNSDETQQTVYISSEQYESDEMGRSSDLSIQNYSNMFNTRYPRNINDIHWSLLNKSDNKIYSLNDQKSDEDNGYPFAIKYDKIPERVYYTISSDFFDEKNIRKEKAVTENYTLPDIYTESNQAESVSISNQHTVSMETDEDLIILSPTSSRTERSKDSESDDKSTALLLQEALEFKKALLTRVELEKTCYIDDKDENMNNESLSEYSKCSYVNNNLQSKFLDIISEEQSVSSSTDRTNRTYMFFNVKQDKQLPCTSTFDNNIPDFTHQNTIEDRNTCSEYFDSTQNLSSSSKYFSVSNISQERNGINDNKLSAEIVPNNSRIKYSNHLSGKFDEKLVEKKFINCLKYVEGNIKGHKICDNDVNEREDSETQFLRMNNTDEFIDHNIDSVELFSQNLNESLFDEENQNLHKNEGCNFLDSDSLKQCTNVLSTKSMENDLREKLNLTDDEKDMEGNETLTSGPNLSLRRHPGTCSLIEQTLVTNIKNTAERHIIENVDAIYESSPSESKENSIETNLIQDSLTSNLNNGSNNAKIAESPPITLLINTSADDEELNFNWPDSKNNFRDDHVNLEDAETLSTSTVTLKKYDYVDIETNKYRETKIHCNQDDTFKDEQNSSVQGNSFAYLGNENSINETEFCKSYSNLISPHSSLYFTDEASSSVVKLNNTHSNHSENNLHSHSNVQAITKKVYYPDENSKDSRNKQDIEPKLSNSDAKTNNKTDIFSSEDYIENRNIPLVEEREQTSKKGNEVSNNKISTLNMHNNNHTLISPKNINTDDKVQSNTLRNKLYSFNVGQNMFVSNTLSCQISPRKKKGNTTMKRGNTMIKSRSQENYILKAEKLKKSAGLQNVKGLKSNLLGTVHTKTESNTTPTCVRVRNSSVEAKRNKEHNIKLDKKRSQSQIAFRSNASANHVTSQSFESPRNANTINHAHSLETKLKTRAKPLLLTPKTSSKSCIPVLKSRLEAARRSENETRPKSPVRGPLTMTMLWRDNLCSKNENVMEESIKLEGKSENNEYTDEINSYGEKTDDSKNHTDKQDLMKASYTIQNLSENIDSNISPQDQMVIYVHIYTKYDKNAAKIIDPNKFLEYVKNRELNEYKENQSNKTDVTFSADSIEKEKSIMNKIVTIVSSIINGNELDENISPDPSTPLTKSGLLADTLSNPKLKHICVLSVEQREIDVTAKPSVIDTSTSISDLEKVSGTSESVLNKFQICGTPKELNNDEYMALLEILHQEPNIVHLQELRNICKKLVSEYQKPKQHSMHL